MEQQDGQQNGSWFAVGKPWENIESRCNPEQERAEQQIDGKDVHDRPLGTDYVAAAIQAAVEMNAGRMGPNLNAYRSGSYDNSMLISAK
jgi:hypothetical protein